MTMTITINQYFQRFSLKPLQSGNQCHVYETPHVVVKLQKSRGEIASTTNAVSRLMGTIYGEAGMTNKLADLFQASHKKAKAQAGGLVVPFEFTGELECSIISGRGPAIFRGLMQSLGVVKEEKITINGLVQLKVPESATLPKMLGSALKNRDFPGANKLLDDSLGLFSKIIGRGLFGADPKPDALAYYDGSLRFVDCGSLGHTKKNVIIMFDTVMREGYLSRNLAVYSELLMTNCRERDRLAAEKVWSRFRTQFEAIYSARHIKKQWGTIPYKPVADVFPLEIAD